MLNKFKFRHSDEAGNITAVMSNSHTCHEIVASFFYFLLGVSFDKKTVLEALEQFLEAHDHE